MISDEVQFAKSRGDKSALLYPIPSFDHGDIRLLGYHVVMLLCKYFVGLEENEPKSVALCPLPDRPTEHRRRAGKTALGKYLVKKLLPKPRQLPQHHRIGKDGDDGHGRALASWRFLKAGKKRFLRPFPNIW